MGKKRKRFKNGWICGDCVGGSWNKPGAKTCANCGMRKKKARLLWFAQSKRIAEEAIERRDAKKKEEIRDAKEIATHNQDIVTARVTSGSEKSDAQLFGADLFALLELVEKNADHIAGGHLSLMRFSSGWKAFYSTPALEMGDPEELEGGYNSIWKMHMSHTINDALNYLLTHPKDIWDDRMAFYEREKKRAEEIHAAQQKKYHSEPSNEKVILKAAQCDIRHDHSIGLCRVPKRKKSKKRKHGRGSIYKVSGCANWFLKFAIHGKQCYVRTSSPDKKVARRILKKEVALELGRWSYQKRADTFARLDPRNGTGA